MPPSRAGLRRRPMPSAKQPSTRYNQSNRILSPGEEKIASNRSSNILSGARVTSDEADAILQELANQDDDSKKTWSRLFVDNYLSKVGTFICYFLGN